MNGVSGESPAFPAPSGATAPGIDHGDDVAATVRRIRRAVIASVTVAYVSTVIAVTGVVATSIGTDRLGELAVTAGTATVVTVVAFLLTSRVLRQVDELGMRSRELGHLYDRALLESLRDGLTGLGNHRAFMEELDRAVQMARRHGQPTALLLIDVDDLKRTNESDGHEAGDEVLQELARVMVANLRRIDRAFRIGGDEFAILSPGTTTDGAAVIARRILAATLDAERRPSGRPISVTIGISAVPEPSGDRSQLYRHADAALYWGKRHGRTDIQVFDPRHHGVADDDRPGAEIVAAIDRILAEGLLRPVYQPIFSLQDGGCLGFEGLVRPKPGASFRGPLSLFIAAESVSRTVELDLAAARAIAEGARDLPPECYLAVNLSPRTLETAAFNPHEVVAALLRAGIEPQRLVIELTEREAIEDMDQLARTLEAFRRTGARIAVDDVGAGHAGLQLLSRLEFDILKIDLTLVQSGAIVAPTRSVMRALIEMATRRGMTTVAEGIETPLQLEALRDLGIQVGQGYLLGMPREAPAAAPLDIARILTSLEPDEDDLAALREAAAA